MALTLKECSPAYVNACVRTFKALLRHAVKRRVIAASPFTEKIKFEEVLLPELELNDAERVAFLGAFDDEAAFRADIGARRREAQVVTSEHFKAPRRFGFGLNPESDASHFVFQRFRALKPADKCLYYRVNERNDGSRGRYRNSGKFRAGWRGVLHEA